MKRINCYAKGRRLEYKTKKELECAGFFVVRQAKSAFPDIIAFRPGIIIAAECKCNGRLAKREIHNLRQIRKKGAVPYLAHPVRDGRRVKIKFKEIF